MEEDAFLLLETSGVVLDLTKKNQQQKPQKQNKNKNKQQPPPTWIPKSCAKLHSRGEGNDSPLNKNKHFSKVTLIILRGLLILDQEV